MKNAVALTEIEERIYKALDDASRGLVGERSEEVWTRGLKEALYDLGAELGFSVWTRSVRGSHEWLWDMCWARCEGDDMRTFKGLAMACEIEWGSGSKQLEDFLKLVVAVAELKLYVCGVWVAKTEDIFTLLKDVCRACPQPPNSRYLIVGVPVIWEYKGEPLPYRAWTV